MVSRQLLSGWVVGISMLLVACGGGKATKTPVVLPTATQASPHAPVYPVTSDNPDYPAVYPEAIYPSSGYPGSASPGAVYPGALYPASGYPPSTYPFIDYPEPASIADIYPGSVITIPNTSTNWKARANPTSTPTAAFMQAPTEIPTATATQIATPTVILPPSPTPTVTPTPTSAYKPGSPQLYATDPATVKLASGGVQFVEFFAFWDGNSRAMAPVVHGLEEIYGKRVNFVYLDIDDPANTQFKVELNYRYQPHFYLLDGSGHIIWQAQGYIPASELESIILAEIQ